MGEFERPPWLKRKYTISPEMASLLGLALGGVLAIICILAPPQANSSDAITALFVVLFGGAMGYLFWLAGEPLRSERFLTIWGLVACSSMLGFLVALPPDSLWGIGRSPTGPLSILGILWVIGGLAMLAVGAGFAIVQLLLYVAFSFRQRTKPRTAASANAVWDRDLDPFR